MTDKETKVMALEDIFSDADLTLAERIYNKHLEEPYKGGVAAVLCQEVVEPSIQMINWRTGGENDPMYLSYALENAFNQMAEDPKQTA